MKKACLFFVGLGMLLGCAARAQTMVGVWQGTLPAEQNPQVVVKLLKSEAGGLRGTFYWVDKYSGWLPLSSVSVGAGGLSLESLYVGVSYQAKLSADGKSLSGTWTQDKKTYPLTLQLTAAENVWKHESVAVPVTWMAERADPSFEVATVKPSVPGATQLSFNMRTRRFIAKNSTVFNLFKFAYSVQSRQIEGAPAWFDQERFDIVAEPDVEGQPSDDQFRTMVKKLLADRFGLKMHTVQRVFSVYALTVEKSPPKIDHSEAGVNPHGNIVTGGTPDGETYASFMDESMPELADILMNFIPERQIVDETGLTGRYDFTMSMPLSVLQSSDDNEKAAGFVEALKPLGFKLVPKKEPLNVFVIDKLERPSAN